MKDLKQILQTECHGKDLEQRKRWYSPAAEAYNQVRPRYPQWVIDQVINIAQLSTDSKLLEVGCGPGTATTSFATGGCSMLCLEPNPDFYRLAQKNCASYPKIELQNLSFEEWKFEPGKFDAVLAASSFHWIVPEIGYPKAAAALRPQGYLILLWNKELQPRYEVYQQLSEVYHTYAPSLSRSYESSTQQTAILDQLGQMAIASGCFKDLRSGHMRVEVTYSVDQYLLLLNTYSPYLNLDPLLKQHLFAGLRQVLEQNGDRVQLSYVSAFHMARPNQS